jgi:BirA family biotin operon repressor/biotin-[acetyl-CoA-carboxylase] ligase
VERLTPPAAPNPMGGPVVHLDVTGSTNDVARDLAAAGAPDGTVVLAEEQTAGRGRQGRVWVAPRGRALTLSAVVRAGGGELALLPLTAAMAVCEACERAAAVECTVKWPNDVWVGERKLSGILIEARPQEGWAAVGIGLNVATSADELPSELRDSATSLAIATGAAVDRQVVLHALLERLAAWVSSDRDGVLAAYRRRDALYGRTIAWTGGEGEARGIDEEGNLVVFREDGERLALSAGEVHLLGASNPKNRRA